MAIRIQEAPFDPGAELNALAELADGAGAIVAFTGLVRSAPDDPIASLTLECYPEARHEPDRQAGSPGAGRFSLIESIVIHRYGTLRPGEPIVQVMTVAPHRGAAFEAAQFLMDYLKTDAPFWKKARRPMPAAAGSMPVPPTTRPGRAGVDRRARPAAATIGARMACGAALSAHLTWNWRLRRILAVLAMLAALQTGSLADARSLPFACDGALPDCLLHEATAAAEHVGGMARDEIQFAIAVALGHLGRFDAAMQAAANLTAPRTLADAQGEISIAAARAGDFDRAYAIALAIADARDVSPRTAAFETLAIAQARAGQIDAAFDTVAAITNPYRRSEAQAAIALAAAQEGDIPGAMRAASLVGTNYWFSPNQHQLLIASGVVARSGGFDHFWFYEAMANIAQTQARHGDILGALQTARSIPDAAGRSQAAARIAAVQAEQGDIDGALATARRVEVPYGDLEALVAIARSKAGAGDFAGALEIASELVTAYGHSGGLEAIAVEQAKQGRFDDSLKSTARIWDVETRTKALAGIARTLVQRGQVDEALTVVGMIQSDEARPLLVKDLAVLLAADGKVARALEMAAEFAGRRNYLDVVVAIALAQAGAGDLDGAIATAIGIEDTEMRAIALAGTAPFAA